MTIYDYLWQFMTICDNLGFMTVFFTVLSIFWILTILTIFNSFWQFDNCDNFYVCWPFCQYWLILANVDYFFNFYQFWTVPDNARELWHLRHWLQFCQLRTLIVDNICNLTFKSDTGQHSQFLRCFQRSACRHRRGLSFGTFGSILRPSFILFAVRKAKASSTVIPPAKRALGLIVSERALMELCCRKSVGWSGQFVQPCKISLMSAYTSSRGRSAFTWNPK